MAESTITPETAALNQTAADQAGTDTPKGHFTRALDEAKARESLAAAEEARRNASSELEIAKVEAEMSSIAAQLAAIRKLRGK